MVKIAINGLGRIGRAIIRAAAEYEFDDIEIVAANGPALIEQHAHLIKYDSVHGIFNGDIKIDNDYLIVNDNPIKLYRERSIDDLDWTREDVDIVLECSGKFNKKSEASKHIARGAKKVIVSAPCENADTTIIYKVNNESLSPDHKVISVGSCTTNCLAPIAKVMNETIGIKSGFMTTIHSYTNDQNILDGSHKDLRRARAGAVSMVPTTTGAAKSIELILPELKGKLAGSAVRVPTPNVSLVDLSFESMKSTSIDEVNQLLIEASKNSLENVLAVTNEPLVSTDFNHNPNSSIVDLLETHVINDKFVRVLSWYDNEWAFSVRMLDLTRLVARDL